jgi:hypothetical protein
MADQRGGYDDDRRIADMIQKVLATPPKRRI